VSAITVRRPATPQRAPTSAAAAAGPVEVVLIHRSGHNDTYDIGGRSYRDKMWQFIGRTVP